MKTNLQALFDLSKLEKRKTPDQKEFEQTHQQILIDFRESVFRSMDRLHKEILEVIEPESQDNKLAAIAMSGYLRGDFIRNYPFLCRRATRSRFKLITDQGDLLYIKKLDKKKRPRNVLTKASALILHQLTAKNGGERGANVFLGYTEPGDYSHATGTYAVCIDGDEVKWISDLSLLGGAELTGPAIKDGTPPATPNQPKLKEGTVRLKKRKNE